MFLNLGFIDLSSTGLWIERDGDNIQIWHDHGTTLTHHFYHLSIIPSPSGSTCHRPVSETQPPLTTRPYVLLSTRNHFCFPAVLVQGWGLKHRLTPFASTDATWPAVFFQCVDLCFLPSFLVVWSVTKVRSSSWGSTNHLQFSHALCIPAVMTAGPFRGWGQGII